MLDLPTQKLYGSTSHLTVFLLAFAAIWGPLILVVGPQFPPVLFCACAAITCMVFMGADDFTLVKNKEIGSKNGSNGREITADNRNLKVNINISRYRMSVGDICIVWMLAHHIFFVTGHFTQLNTLCVSGLLVIFLSFVVQKF